MGSNGSDFLNKLQDTLFNANWMNELYGEQRADQQKKLKELFTVVSDNNVTASQKRGLEAQAETLADKVERLEAKMAVLAEEMTKSEAEIAKHANEITNYLMDVESKSEKMQEKQMRLVKYATDDVFYMYRKGQIGHDAIVPEIRRRIKNGSTMDSDQAAIEKILAKLDGKEAKVQGLVDSAARWMDQKNLLEAQYGATKSAYDMLKVSIGQIGATETNYQNVDLGVDVPVYSPAKVGAIADLMDNAAYNVPATNRDFKEGTGLLPKDELNNKYKDFLGTPATNGVDSNSTKNATVQNLGKALDMGLIDDMVSSGMNYSEMAEFLSTNFAGANIKYKDGKLSIPYGHGNDAQAIYTKLTDGIKNFNTGFLGQNNTWDAAGNTISSNDQIGALKKFIEDGGLQALANGNPPFTFKEAMQALFNPESGLFKDSGVIYDVSKQGNRPNYFVEFAGDRETADMYQNMADEIFNLWGVKPSRGADFEQFDENIDPVPTENPNPNPTRTDPIWFDLGDKNQKFSFVIDRERNGVKDGKFTDMSEFVGAKEGSSWLDDLKSLDANNDGKLTGNELKELKIFGTKYNDSAKNADSDLAYDPNENKNGNKYFRTSDNKVEYSMSNAHTMGIDEINLEGLESAVTEDPNAYEKLDANGNAVFNDSFKFTMNGKEVTAHRLDEDATFMETIYGDAKGKHFDLSLSEANVDEIMKKDYGEFDEFDAKFANLFANVGILKNAGAIAHEAREMYEDSVENIKQYENAELLKATNKAAAEGKAAGWTKVSYEVQSIAINEGITIDMVQAEGIYNLNESLDARGVVNEYKRQQKMLADAEAFSANRKEIANAIILVAKNGMVPDADKITDLLTSGEAKTAEDVVAILKKAQAENNADYEVVTRELGFDSEREEEIYNAFNSLFADRSGGALDIGGAVIKGLADLCAKQIQTAGKYMQDKGADELAQLFMKKYLPEQEAAPAPEA